MDPLFWIEKIARYVMSSKIKGSRWERDCAKRLSLWLSDNERDDLVWRTASSGGRFTQRKKRGQVTCNQAGDLCATDPSVQYFFDYALVECKNGYTQAKTKKSSKAVISVLQAIDRLETTKDPLIFQWWDKAIKERDGSGRRRAMLIFKRDKKIPCILIEKQWILELSAYNGQYRHNMILLKLEKYPILAICDLEKWLDWCSPQSIQTLQKTWSKNTT